MKKLLNITLLILLLVFLSACHEIPVYTTAPTPPSFPTPTASSSPEEPPQTTDVPETTIPETTSAPTLPLHSILYLPEYSVEDVILYFNEVCLDGEYIISGDPSVVQKWTVPIYYMINGTATEEDLSVISTFTQWLNALDGFPGIYETEDLSKVNLRIYFGDQQGMLSVMGETFTDLDGAVTFWYLDDEIYDATIYYLADIDQQLRNSVILEEIYNGLGPIQDTVIRSDSIIYQEFSTAQCLSPMDELILKLLYHPDIQCGMNAEQCAQIIRQLYY